MLKTEAYFVIVLVLMLVVGEDHGIDEIGFHDDDERMTRSESTNELVSACRFVRLEHSCSCDIRHSLACHEFDQIFDFAQDDFRCQFHREINRGDHAVGTRDAFARNFKCSAVVGTGARKRQPERYVHAAVECVELQRNQSLIVVHAKYRVEFAFNRSVENGVRRNRTNDFRFTILDSRLQFLNCRRDDFNFFDAEFAGFAGVRIESGNGNARTQFCLGSAETPRATGRRALSLTA